MQLPRMPGGLPGMHPTLPLFVDFSLQPLRKFNGVT